MLKTLVKKQLFEVFKGYFYDAKKNKMRSKLAIAGWFVFFVLIVVGLLGGMFLALSMSLCAPMTEVGMDCLYFLIMGTISIFLGAFGSVYNCYTALYLSKDNDLLLALPIPVRTIVASRLLNVYLMGTMYLLTVMIPMELVYMIVTGVTVSKLICGLLLFFVISFFVLALSCVLGLAVAKISLKLKHKSFATVFITIVFIALYYVVYFKAGDIIRDILANAESYGERIKGAAYVLYLFGKIGTGDILCAVIFTAVMTAITVVIWKLLLKSFTSIATATGKVERIRYTEKTVRQKSVFGAVLFKEFARFTASPNYMLNCGLGILLLPALGVYMLLQGHVLLPQLKEAISDRPDCGIILLCTALCLMTAMIDTAAPSVSLEGKDLWILQSLPVKPAAVLRAKAMTQILLAGVPMLIACILSMIGTDFTISEKILLLVMPLMYVVFSALVNTVIAIKFPLLSWTNETEPIKHSGGVFISIMGSWIIVTLFALIYMFFGYEQSTTIYMLYWVVALLVLSLIMTAWLEKRGAAIFAEL
ncbi:hypothetical protein [Butyrivibrio sp. VCD2006]|uniref:hypothetical protein n=1 Tax=Butyrivibrio sp. VCD2006 TaxID=1280664 RepID=UPI0004137C20|nr:hypothetical protein [Butyrivibrio sp. VCD2006]